MMPAGNEVTVNAFLPPDQLFLNEPSGIRALAFECLARDLHKLFNEKREEITTTLMQKHGIGRIEANIKAFRYFEQVRSMYAQEAENIAKPLREAMNRAIVEEKAGDFNKAIQLFEELSDNAFAPSMPYERLRVIYSKQGYYDEAIRICQRYVEVLKMIKEFWSDYSNIRLISKYEEYIEKLSGKLKK